MITNIDLIGAEIVDSAYRLHRTVGPGMLESVYERLLMRELTRRGLQVERQRAVRFEHESLLLEDAFYVDLLVNGRVVVEVKAVERILPVHRMQTYTYLRALGLRLGYLLNFGAALMKDGTYRVVNDYRPTAESRLRIHQKRESDG